MLLFSFVTIIIDVVVAINIALHPRLNILIARNVFNAMTMFLLAIDIAFLGLNNMFIVMNIFLPSTSSFSMVNVENVHVMDGCLTYI